MKYGAGGAAVVRGKPRERLGTGARHFSSLRTPETLVRIEYHLTEKGRSLEDMVVAIQRWASEWVAVSTY